MDIHHGINFKNRADAGEQLGVFLRPKYKDQNPLIIGIPRGGIEIAWQVALILEAELTLVVSKKLPLPGQPEYGIGAIAEEHAVYVSPDGTDMLSPSELERLIAQQEKEVNRRIDKYRNGNPLPEMTGRSIIIVDDGIATGATLVPVIRLCRQKNAAEIIIAAPVSGSRYDKNLEDADHIEILVQPANFYAVGQAYDDFEQVTDEEVLEILHKAKNLNKHNHGK